MIQVKYVWKARASRWIIQTRSSSQFFWRTCSHSWFDPIYFTTLSEAKEFISKVEL